MIVDRIPPFTEDEGAVLPLEQQAVPLRGVRAVGGVIELVVDGERGAARQPEVLDELPRLHGNPVRSRGRLHRDGEPILRAVPDFELVFGSILDSVPDDGPLELGFQPACRHAALSMIRPMIQPRSPSACAFS